MAVWDDVLPDTDRKVFEAEVAPRHCDVLELDEVPGYLDGLDPGLFDAEFPAVRDAGGVAR